MPPELLLPEEMARADRIAAAYHGRGSFELMLRAGSAVTGHLLRARAGTIAFDVLCGPGNNGGDGYVVAAQLAEAGARVRLWREGAPKAGSDAAQAAAMWTGEASPLSEFRPRAGHIVVDALYGAGLSRGLEGAAAGAAEACSAQGARVVAIDLPSGISGASGQHAGPAFRAELTITFFRRKPGHLLLPGRTLCGEIAVADIGIPEAVIAEIAPTAFENLPEVWHADLPVPSIDAHKYQRGHVAVFSGGPSSTGAARLSAAGAARAGAGALTVLSPSSAMLVNATHLTSSMLARADNADEALQFIRERRVASVVLGPGFGVGELARDMVLAVLAHKDVALVLDADGITSFRDQPQNLFDAAARSGSPLVITPHEGEFVRLFPDLAGDTGLSKLDRARHAAKRTDAVIVYKGPDTVIAAPDGRAAINTNGVPWLATAGSGDVLAGIIAGLLAQRMPAWQAACAAVWIHGEAGRRFGPGLIAEDLPGLLPEILSEIFSSTY